MTSLLLAAPTLEGLAAGQPTGGDEEVVAFGDAAFLGSTSSLPMNAPVVGIAPTPSGAGYWLVAADGGVFTFGDARFAGSLGGVRLNAPVVALVPTASGNGYWLFAADGGVFAFGDATFFGSMGAVRLNRPVVGGARTPTGQGYWLVAADGGIFSFGDAAFLGSMGAVRLNQPVVGMAAAAGGYWLVAADGGVFSFGLPVLGSMGGVALNAPVVAVGATADGSGYRLAARDGGVFTFGSAGFHGSASLLNPHRPVVAMATTPSGQGYWLAGSGACSFAGAATPRAFLPESHVLEMTALHTGAGECWERVVFDFRDEAGAPDANVSFEVGYASPPFSGPSGEPVPVAGQAHLQIVFRGARTYSQDGAPVYTGPREVRPAGLSAVREVQLVEDFEAVLVWVVGLDRRRQFNVYQLDRPDRLVLDIGPPVP
ncbi:MAG TPA: hypothetical protein VFV35_06635 [Acidimicrobiales bacterium]|nr:hypothetical protein [Acidimicrobiales bacterium]